MNSVTLPWPAPPDGHSHEGGGTSCPLRAQLTPALRDAAEGAPHLFRYLHAVPADELALVAYHGELSYELSQLPRQNLIYPTGDAGYAHVYSDFEDAYDYYISIEPSFGIDLGLIAALERRLIGTIETLAHADSDDELSRALCEAVDDGALPHRREKAGNGNKSESGSAQGPATSNEVLEAVKYAIVRDKVGQGPLQPLLKDEYVQTISCSGVGRLFLEHRIFGSLKTAFAFESFEQLDDLVLRLSQKVGRPLTDRNPIVDAILAGGARINIVYGSAISKRGTNFTISKTPSTPMSILDLVALGTLDYTIAAYLSLVVGKGLNVFICGEGGSGKTTLLNAISAFVPSEAKIVSIEDTPELRVPHTNWLREVIREGAASEASSDVTVFSLLKAALRQRPNAIIMGEIRGEEGNTAFQAMQTGHAVMSTIHASSVERLIQRLTGKPISVPKVYIDNLNVAVIVSSVRLPDGRHGRRVLSVNEIVGFDSQADAFSFVEVFRWDGSSDSFEFVPQSHLLEQIIAFRLGIPPERKKAIYDELARRAALFEQLHVKRPGFFELCDLLTAAHKEDLF